MGHAHEIGGSSISAADFGFCRAVIEAGIEPSMTTTAADSRASLDPTNPQRFKVYSSGSGFLFWGSRTVNLEP